jgi:hypothetical protein
MKPLCISAELRFVSSSGLLRLEPVIFTVHDSFDAVNSVSGKSTENVGKHAAG